MMRPWIRYLLVAGLTSIFWLAILFEPIVGSWPGFSGIHIQQRWGGGPMLQIGYYDNGAIFGVLYYPPSRTTPWGVLNDGKQLWIQKGS